MNTAVLSQRLLRYVVLTRLNKPIGILLLLWPTLWALWLAQGGLPSANLLWIFCLGTVLMRSAGCIMNDIADRHFDPHVARTQQRPLACHVVSVREAIGLFIILTLLAFILLLQLNKLAIYCGIAALVLVIAYPFAKRYTHLPQVVLGLTFYASIPMAFAATLDQFSALAWWLYATAGLWAVIYDTFYAMVDREDDLKIGIKSTAVLFGNHDKMILAYLQILFVSLLFYIGYLAQLIWPYYIAVMIAAVLCIYHQMLIKHRQPAACFRAFLHSNWLGFVIFVGIVTSLPSM